MKPNAPPHDTQQPLADDLLRGAEAIAEFLFGERKSRRKVYYLAQYTRLPVFRLGSQLCARRSVLLNWIAAQESRGQTGSDGQPGGAALVAVAVHSKGASR